MKKILVIVVMMLSSAAMFAQTTAGKLTVQPKVGMNIANLTDLDGSKSLIGLAAGAELEYGLTDMLSLSAGAMFSMQGAKFDEDGAEAKAKLNYLTVPVLANVYVLPGLAVKLGLQPAFKLSAKAKAEGGGIEVEQTIARADYIHPYSACLHKDNFYATQFHPEKSGKVGEQILKNFLEL